MAEQKAASLTQGKPVSLYGKINSDWQTRIIALQPGPFGNPIVAELHVVDLLHAEGAVLHKQQQRIQSFEALSYCWGEPIFDRSLTCNAVPFPITQSLYFALQRVRSAEDVVYLWIDAVCINQADDDERSRQVAQMMTIYMKAHEVIVWLGEKPSQLSLRTALSLAEDSGARNNTIEELRQIPWFQRVWVRQEVWAARKIVVRHSDEVFSWDVFTEASIKSLVDGFPRPDKFTRMTIKDDGDQANVFLHAAPDSDIVNILRRCVGSRCSNLRDVVYGLIGMAAMPIRTADQILPREPCFTIDYRKSASEVFQDLAVYVMKRDKALNVLYLDARFGGTVDNQDLPSWTPDWRRPTGHSFLSFVKGLFVAEVKYRVLQLVGRSVHKPRQPGIDTHRDYLDPCTVSDGSLEIRGWLLGTLSAHVSNIADDRLSLRLSRLPLERVEELKRQTHQINRKGPIYTIHEHLRAFSEEYVECIRQDQPLEMELDSHTFSLQPQEVAVERTMWLPTCEFNYYGDWHMLETPSGPGLAPLHDYLNFYSAIDNVATCEPFLEKRDQFSRWFHDNVDLSEGLEYFGESPFWDKPLNEWFPAVWGTYKETQKGDLIVAARGGLLPIVLRPRLSDMSYEFVGPAIMLQATNRMLDYDLQSIGPARYELLKAVIAFNESQDDDFLSTYRIA